jgi:hypothetical protein
MVLFYHTFGQKSTELTKNSNGNNFLKAVQTINKAKRRLEA